MECCCSHRSYRNEQARGCFILLPHPRWSCVSCLVRQLRDWPLNYPSGTRRISRLLAFEKQGSGEALPCTGLPSCHQLCYHVGSGTFFPSILHTGHSTQAGPLDFSSHHHARNQSLHCVISGNLGIVGDRLAAGVRCIVT